MQTKPELGREENANVVFLGSRSTGIGVLVRKAELGLPQTC